MSLPFVEEGETSENLTQSIHTPAQLNGRLLVERVEREERVERGVRGERVEREEREEREERAEGDKTMEVGYWVEAEGWRLQGKGWRVEVD
ncbi:unnamed protein product [Boreogadus saida]